MICPYCGHEYADDLLRCPHCGAENTEEAREQQQETLQDLDEERQEIRREPGRILRQADRTAAGIGFRILAGALILAVLTAAGSFAWKLWQQHTLAANVEKLENCLAEGDYERLDQLLERIDSYAPAYRPFYPVQDAWQYLTYARDDLEWFRQDLEAGLADSYLLSSLSFALKDSMIVLMLADAAQQDGMYLGNEEALLELRELAYAILTEELLVTDAEMEEMAMLYEEQEVLYDETPFASYALQCLERME